MRKSIKAIILFALTAILIVLVFIPHKKSYAGLFHGSITELYGVPACDCDNSNHSCYCITPNPDEN